MWNSHGKEPLKKKLNKFTEILFKVNYTNVNVIIF